MPTANKKDETIILLIDGVKYNPWIPEKEEQLESMIKEHTKEIFGNDSLYFGIKQRIVSRTGIGSIPDGYLIKFQPLEWYIVEADHPTLMNMWFCSSIGS